MNHFADLVYVNRLAVSDQPAQRIGNCVLALTSGQLQDLHILFVGHAFHMSRAQRIVSHTKLRRGKQLFAIPIVGERARLTHQRIDDVPIVDRHTLLAEQSRHRLDVVILVGHDDLLRAQPHVNLLADQPAGNGVGVGPHLDCAALADADARQDVVSTEPMSRQVLQTGLFFGEPLLAMGVGTSDDFLHEAHVVLTTGEVTAAAEHQSLVDAILEVTIG